MGPDNNIEIENIEKFRVLHQNATLGEARVFLLGDRHTDMGHDIDIQQFINGHIDDGDIVLVEGVEANQKLDSKKYFQTDSISKNINVYGWDDINLRDQAASNVRQLIILKDAIANAKEEGNDTLGQMLNEEFWKLKEGTDKIAITQRNESLKRVLTKAAKEYPDKKIFIRGGSKHFYGDPKLTDYLNENFKYIALEPVSEDLEGKGEKTLEYFTASDETPVQSNKDTQPLNKVLIIELPDGTTQKRGAAWFLDGGSVNVGDTVFINKDVGLESDRKELKIGEGYKVIAINK